MPIMTPEQVTALCSVVLTVIVMPIFYVAFGIRDDMRWMKGQFGSRNPPEGVLGDLEAMKRETLKHRDRLIRLEVEQGLKIEDRT